MAIELKTLSSEEVIKIHEILIKQFEATSDPIFPAGVKSISLLQSAVGRQLQVLAE